jgi:hypothetical protein
MVECYGTERCVYLIEGGECESTELGGPVCRFSWDRITVIKTVNIEDTACVVEISSLAEEGRIGARDGHRSLRKSQSPDTLSLRYLHSYRISQEYR